MNCTHAIENNVFFNSNKAAPVYMFLNDTFFSTSMGDL